MARVLEGSHSFTCTPRVHPLTGWTIPLPSQPKLVLIYRPRKDGRLSWPWVAGWLHTEINVRHGELNPDTVAHLSTNRARRWLTSLIEANALTTTPDHQPALLTDVLFSVVRAPVSPYIRYVSASVRGKNWKIKLLMRKWCNVTVSLEVIRVQWHYFDLDDLDSYFRISSIRQLAISWKLRASFLNVFLVGSISRIKRADMTLTFDRESKKLMTSQNFVLPSCIVWFNYCRDDVADGNERRSDRVWLLVSEGDRAIDVTCYKLGIDMCYNEAEKKWLNFRDIWPSTFESKPRPQRAYLCSSRIQCNC